LSIRFPCHGGSDKGLKMKQMTINNLSIMVDCLTDDPDSEVKQLIEAINNVISGWDSSPVLSELDAIITVEDTD